MNKHFKIISILVLTIVLSISVKGQTFNYAEALQKSMFFYECQRSGTLPVNNRVNWRGNSGLTDGSDVSKDLTGGWYDAGDHVKFNFPMAFTATALAWGAIEFEQGYTSSGQLSYLKSNLRWANDYFIKCHTAPNELYGQVGNGGTDHAWWGSCEVMQMARPSYKIDASNPGSDLAAETAASLASASIVFAKDDPTYSATLLTHAKQLYTFADTYRGKYSSAISDAGAYYNSWSGYQDELVWGAIWLYLATKDQAYLTKAEAEYDNLGVEGQSTDKSYKWGIAWDDKSYGCYVLLAKITGKAKYKTDAERHLDYWTDGYNGSKITYTPGGLAWLDTWGSLRYAANTSFLAFVYSNITTDATKKAKYYNFGVSQIGYILGNNPQKRSFVCGFGTNPPVNPHHRTAHGAWANNLNGPPVNSRHTIYGALVGGPGSGDAYADDRSNFTSNEIACDYNALFSGDLAKLAQDNASVALASFPTPETPKDEYLVEAKINSSGTQFTEYSVWVENHTAWPSRIPSQFKYRLFVDITEGLAAGYKSTDYVVSANGSGVTFTSLKVWDAAKNIYYTEVTYNSSIVIWPGGQGESAEESQIRIRLPYEAPAAAWNAANDWSYQGLTGTLGTVTNIPLYVDGVLVVGNEPSSIAVASVSILPTTASVAIGGTTQLAATVLPTSASNKAVTWTTSNAAIATVSTTGLVTGVASGTATITVTTQDGSKTASSVITVTTIPVSSVTVAATASVAIGSATQITATIAPANATNKAVTWASSNTAIATVSATGLVTGVAKGSVIITVSSVDGAKTASCSVTVVKANISVTGVSLNKTTASLMVDSIIQLTASVLPDSATNKNVTWASSNTAVATVSSTGLITAVAAGSAIITVTSVDGAKTSTCTVTVTAPIVLVTGVSLNASTVDVSIGATLKLIATVLPANATNKNVTWTTSSATVATVSSTGLVTGVAVGSAIITATTVDGAKIATCTITVTEAATCTFGAPLATSLPNISTSYTKVYVLGTGGPNLSNVTNFTINWSLANNGLYQLSIGTSNGIPSWYNDLRTVATYKFNQAQPEITFASSGFAGLDGAYWVTVDGANLALVSKTGGYTIYLSNSATAPACLKSAKMLSEESTGTVKLYPNPVRDGRIAINISIEKAANVSVTAYNQVGKVVLKNLFGKYETGSHSIQLNTNLPVGIYFFEVKAGDFVKVVKVEVL